MNEAYQAILKRLSGASCDYDILEHPPVFTMQDVDRLLKIPFASRVKTMVLEVVSSHDADYVLCGISADARLDMKSVASVLGVPRSLVAIMAPDRVEAITGLPRGAIGLIPATGNPTILVSPRLAGQRFICFGVGRNDRTLRISTACLRTVVQYTIAEIEQKVTLP